MKTRKLAVIDYGTGNLCSVVKAFEYLGAKVNLATKAEDMKDVDAVIFPGQGSFDQCMSSIENHAQSVIETKINSRLKRDLFRF